MRYTWSRAALGLIGVLLLISSSNINWGKEHWRTVMQADAKGYYAYLPAIFIYHDPNIGFFDRIERDTYYNRDLFYDYRAAHNGRTIPKYFMGTALVQAPFFLVAHAITSLTGGVRDGYSKPYVVAINLAAIAWVLLGCWALLKLLASYGVRDLHIAFTLLAFTFGTNLFYYTVVAPGMSHAYSFGLISLFLWKGRQLWLGGGTRDLVVLVVLLGLIVLVRPVNGMVVLALAVLMPEGNKGRALADLLRSQRLSALAVAALIALSIPLLQLGYYKWATGSWLVYAYGEEGFQWTSPALFDFLFSYKKGAFVYTPLLLLSMFGIVPLFRSDRQAALAWGGFFVLLVYVLSSWWNWWYGGSFGSRVLVEFLGPFALLFGLLLARSTAVVRRSVITLTVLLTVLCQVQTYQARYYQIHWEDMDQERYWKVFLRVDQLGCLSPNAAHTKARPVQGRPSGRTAEHSPTDRALC